MTLAWLKKLFGDFSDGVDFVVDPTHRKIWLEGRQARQARREWQRACPHTRCPGWSNESGVQCEHWQSHLCLQSIKTAIEWRAWREYRNKQPYTPSGDATRTRAALARLVDAAGLALNYPNTTPPQSTRSGRTPKLLS